jgi:hypothetical protein
MACVVDDAQNLSVAAFVRLHVLQFYFLQEDLEAPHGGICELGDVGDVKEFEGSFNCSCVFDNLINVFVAGFVVHLVGNDYPIRLSDIETADFVCGSHDRWL